MLSHIGNTINISAGMELKLTIPVDPDFSMGKFALKGENPITKKDELINGFGTKYPEVGKVSKLKESSGEDQGGENDTEGTVVVYKHEKSELNTIWFFALTGEIGVVEIVSVPIHDHSTIVQGGPAYGTYFSEYT